MSEVDELYAPFAYNPVFLWIVAGILAFIIIAVVVILMMTKPLSIVPVKEADTLPTQDAIAQLRGEYLTAIDGIEQAYSTRSMSPKDANRALSTLVRSFVNEYSGLEAPVLSLSDLKDMGVPHSLLDAIQRHYYPSIFRRGAAVDPVAGAKAARTVVASWN